MHKYRWSDLEYVLTVASAGSVAAAARTLNVNHTTVLRRVQAFERNIKVRIFERLRSGYRPTPEGEIFLDAARSIETTVDDLDRKIAGSDKALRGPLSITTTDTIAPLIMDEIAAFRRQHPGVVVDLRVANVHLNLDRRESDIAIRPSNNPPVHLVGRRVCDFQFCIYTAKPINPGAAAEPLEKQMWLGLEAPISGSVAGEWIEKRIPETQVIFRSNSFNTLRNFAESGLGYAMLPCIIGDTSEKLIRIEDKGKTPAAGLWLLSHGDLLRSPRVRAATDFLYKGLSAKRALFEGKTRLK